MASRNALQRLLHGLFDRSPELLLTHLVRDEALDRDTLQRLRDLVDSELSATASAREAAPRAPERRMTIAWMLCYLAVGMLLAIVAAALDALAAQLRYRRRFIWLGAMLAMCVLPLALSRIDAPLPLRDVTARAVRLPEALPTTAPIANAVNAGLQAHEPSLMLRVTKSDRNAVVIEPGSVLRRGDLLLPGLSLMLSGTSLVLLAGAARRMRRARRHWTLTDTATSELVSRLAGRRVRTWVSESIGPAAFGVRRPQVVIPRWADALDAPARALLLTHEASHIGARDPLLLRIALGLVVLLPWNVALLYAYRRLHRAVEHDCDARVLRAGANAWDYGRLLVDAAEQLSAGGSARHWSRAARWLPVAAAGIGVQRSDLELRLRALARPVSTWRSRVRNLVAVGVMVAAGLAACSVPAPQEQREQPKPAALAAASVNAASDSARGRQTVFDSLGEMDTAFLEYVPDLDVRLDSIVAAAAREALPHVFSPDGSERFVWLLFDARYHVVASAVGAQHAFISSGTRPELTDTQRATPTTPLNRISVSIASYLHAFPQLAREDIGRWSTTYVSVKSRRILINWAQDLRPLRPAAAMPLEYIAPVIGQPQTLPATEGPESYRIGVKCDAVSQDPRQMSTPSPKQHCVEMTERQLAAWMAATHQRPPTTAPPPPQSRSAAAHGHNATRTAPPPSPSAGTATPPPDPPTAAPTP